VKLPVSSPSARCQAILTRHPPAGSFLFALLLDTASGSVSLGLRHRDPRSGAGDHPSCRARTTTAPDRSPLTNDPRERRADPPLRGLLAAELGPRLGLRVRHASRAAVTRSPTRPCTTSCCGCEAHGIGSTALVPPRPSRPGCCATGSRSRSSRTLLGHARLSTHLSIYGHLRGDARRALEVPDGHGSRGDAVRVAR